MKLKHRLIALGIITLFTTSTSIAASYKPTAAEPAAPKPLHDGFYLGVAATYDNFSGRQNASVTDPVTGSVFSVDPMLTVNGFGGGVFGGFGKDFTPLVYLGIELYGYNRSNTKSYAMVVTDAAESLSYTDQVQVRANYGVSILPGVKLNDSTLFYVRLGYNRNHLQVTETAINTVDGVTFVGKANKWQSGFNYGLGIESAVYGNLSLRGDYSYTSFNHFTNSSVGTRYSFSDNEFQLGLIYHFA